MQVPVYASKTRVPQMTRLFLLHEIHITYLKLLKKYHFLLFFLNILSLSLLKLLAQKNFSILLKFEPESLMSI